ncbi:hypothetical protein DR871_009130 [Flavobacterium petrolei]|jgi:hypothetical protein|uniref:Lipocalin-like domain-containing protein n=1 Tax=Flavobacterium petrolei TaxID=2259594 RepID=A0A482TLI6_9FLAO|nr:DUF5004 domain-containing protein [Flavobacterium petrolei]RYJ52378.1 hypothetical protein DR871_009130 [Flavobacterium petrolei]
MKKYLFILSILLFSNHIISQEITQENIIGKWKVIKVLKKIENPNLKDIVKSFNTAIFEFKENSDFKLTTADNSKLFSMFTNMTNNSKWKLNKNNYVISIGNQSDGYNILKIIVAEVNGKIIFHLSETELDLEVQKV